MTPIQSNKTVFFNLSGEPLNGTIYIGQPNTDPRTNAKTVTFRDAGGTTFTAAQPLKTVNGRIVYNGLPITALVDGEYSLLMFDSAGNQVVYDPSVTESGGGGSVDSFSELLRVGLTLDEIKEFDVSVGDSVRSIGKDLTTDNLGADWLVVSATGNPADDVDLIDFSNGLQGRRVNNVVYAKDYEDVAPSIRDGSFDPESMNSIWTGSSTGVDVGGISGGGTGFYVAKISTGQLFSIYVASLSTACGGSVLPIDSDEQRICWSTSGSIRVFKTGGGDYLAETITEIFKV